MKKFITFIVILFLIIGGIGGYFGYKIISKNMKEAKIKEGWYVEIIHDDPIKVRTEPSTKGKLWGEVKKGEIYEVLDINLESSSYYWYKIDFNGKTGWIASGRKNPWVNDYNNPTDIAVPIIKFDEDVYTVATIKDINYKHLTVVEDTDKYEITHQIYHEVVPEEFKDQYWIYYTITDGAGKSSSKLQKIEFGTKPDESEVLDFKDLKR